LRRVATLKIKTSISTLTYQRENSITRNQGNK
jgi:hypothetical protein